MRGAARLSKTAALLQVGAHGEVSGGSHELGGEIVFVSTTGDDAIRFGTGGFG
jgi:hypothetical protein